jgi:hypothetical protein
MLLNGLRVYFRADSGAVSLMPKRVRQRNKSAILVFRIADISIRIEAGATSMRRWYLPLTVLGLSGLGVFIASDVGQKAVRRIIEGFEDAPETFELWNETLQQELDVIQTRLNDIADTLGLGPATAV